MAFRALAFLRAGFKLAFVRVRLMTIRTIRKRHRLLKVAFGVAIHAGNHGVFSEKGIFRFRMVEFERGRQFFPARRRVAILAALLERSFVRINMAIYAGAEFHVLVAHRSARHIGLVAFLAIDLRVQTGQRVARFRVVELLGRFPIREVVALQTVVAELSFVRIFVARYAILGQSEKRLRKILHFDKRALIGNHICRRVAFVASNARMFSLQVVPGQAVIELFLRRLPMNQAEIFAVVVEVTAHAISSIRVTHLQLRVVAVLSGEPLRDFLMAIETFESRRAGSKLVAAGALRGAGQRLVRFRKGSRRDLRTSGRANDDQKDEV